MKFNGNSTLLVKPSISKLKQRIQSSIAITCFVLTTLRIIGQLLLKFRYSFILTHELYHSHYNIMISKLNYIVFSKDLFVFVLSKFFFFQGSNFSERKNIYMYIPWYFSEALQ